MQRCHGRQTEDGNSIHRLHGGGEVTEYSGRHTVSKEKTYQLVVPDYYSQATVQKTSASRDSPPRTCETRDEETPTAHLGKRACIPSLLLLLLLLLLINSSTWDSTHPCGNGHYLGTES